MASRLSTMLAVAAILVFAWLGQRHVGESVFLEDQVDQLQNFESLLRFAPEGLWGPVMSDTNPRARATGPIGAITFGFPVMLGFGIDSIHRVTSALIALSTAVAFFMLRRLEPNFAWLWLLVFSASALVWWNAGLLWVNTLLLPAGLLLLALSASCLARPTMAKLALVPLVALCAMQVHLAAVVAAPVVLIVGALTVREASRRRPRRAVVIALSVLALAAVGPYVMAEFRTGFENTRAIVMHLGTAANREDMPALPTAIAFLSMGADPARLSERVGGDALALTLGLVCAGASLLIFGARLQGHLASPPEPRTEWVIFWLVTIAAASIVGQAMFFVWTNRSFAGYHYVTLLGPFYAVAPAAAVYGALGRSLRSYRSTAAIGALCLAFLVLSGPALADRYLPPTTWSYQRITAALDTLCAGTDVDTVEGGGLSAQLNPQHDSVLRYLMTRRFSDCRYRPGSEVLIVAARDHAFDEWYVSRDTRYRLEIVLPPGIARYRRWP